MAELIKGVIVLKIFTYQNPYKINETSFWDEIAEYPHLCVSQTLVEGMKKHYGREAFWCIDTIEAFINDFYKAWTDHPENNIKQYISLTNQIEQIQKNNTKKAMKFNQKEVHEAIRFLMELNLEIEKFNQETLSEEQVILLKFANNLKKHEAWSILAQMETQTFEEVKDSFLVLLTQELEREQKINNGTGRAKRENEKRTKFIESILEDYTNEITTKVIKGIVFHGIHQFTPIILKLVRQLESLGIEVVFLFNYDSQYKNIFNTWDKVYRWTNVKISTDKYDNSFLSVKNDLGKAIGGMLEGEVKDWDFSGVEFYKYENLTAFADEISNKYELASKDKDGNRDYKNALARMNEQFYASNNEAINNILQAYFPEQFGDRHFLSYPIGQFILSLYNMWDDKEKTLKISSNLLKECLSVNFFRVEEQPTPLEIYTKIELYFKDIETIDHFRSRLHELIERVRKIELNQENEFYRELRSFSFFNVKYSELQYFGKVIHDLYEITRQVFGSDNSGFVNYKNHYKNLIEIISNKSSTSSLVSEKEKEFVESIKKQFENLDELEIEGTIEDLKETIHFYLNRKNIQNSANWIVRNFEQIDGGILLSRKGKGKKNKYHIAMLSDEKMKVNLNDRLSWPLTKKFFDAYQDEVTDLEIILTSLNEYGNFLRYSLFYATYYLDNDLILSYVENSEREKDKPYFLLEMIGLNETAKDLDQKSLSSFNVDNGAAMSNYSSDSLVLENEEFDTIELQKFSTCSYRYLLDHVIEKDNYFQSEYHCRLYYNALLLKNSFTRIFNENITNYEKVVSEESKRLKGFFPFWKPIDFYDIEARILQSVKDSRFDPYYLQLRLDFLYAQIKESWNEEEDNLISEIHHFRWESSKKRRETSSFISMFIKNNDLSVEKVNPQICNYCKQREICLHHFKEVD